MSKKILIIGSKGMAGQTIRKYLVSKEYEVYCTFRKGEAERKEREEEK